MAYQPTKTDAAGNTLVSAQLATLPQLAQGTAVSAQPHGTMRVTQDPTSIFYDAFSGAVLDVTDRWATTGTAPTQANGVLTLPAGTASTTSVLTSKPVISLSSTQYVLPAFALRFEAAVGTGVGRFWGMGTAPTIPGVNSLAQEGVGFELDSATGALQAVTYTGGVKTVIATLQRPVDGLLHRYSLQYRNSRCYWFIDDLNLYAATATFLNTAIQDLPMQVSSVSGATLTNAPALALTAVGVADLNRQATQLSDGTFPWRKTTIKAPSVPAAATDGALVVALHPSSPLPAGVNTIGSVGVTSLPSLPTGANTIGSVGVTTLPPLPTGSNNIGSVGVSFLPALPVGTNAIGSVGVTSLPALPAGNNVIGQVKEYRAPTFTNARVASLATTQTLLAANVNRNGASIYNESTAILYLKLGATASNVSYTIQIAAGGYYEVPAFYAGIIDGLWATAQGAAQVTEIS